jgi:hypothetical protein
MQLMYDYNFRKNLSDILSEITYPKKIENIDCLKILSDIIRFVLTLFVHEETTDSKLF